jgi:hypothetical protein
MPSARLRYTGAGVLLLLVALGLGLAGFDAVVIVVVMAVALVLVALLVGASGKEAAQSRVPDAKPEEPPAPPQVEPVELEPVAEEEHGVTEPEQAPAVSGRSARALLASAPPPLPQEQTARAAAPSKKPARRPLVERRRKPREAAPPPEPEPQPEPVPTAPPREWNLWELERAVRDTGERHEEWSALLIYLREFANADGDLPLEFDALVRESFGNVVVEPAGSAAPS